MLTDRQQFYKSKKWEAFRRLIINERTEADGYVRCAVCGKPILKPYDLILHHTKELTDENFNDVTVSLNPDNVQCVHFKCHNEIHERFGHNKTGGVGLSDHGYVQKKVFIVYGAPCSGKTTWVRANATADDLIVDLDSIWQMIGISERYDKPASLRSTVFSVRDHLYDLIKYRSGKWHNAYIITGGALKGDRDRLAVRVGADDLIFIDTSMRECIARAAERGKNVEDWFNYINDWFTCFQPDIPPVTDADTP